MSKFLITSLLLISPTLVIAQEVQRIDEKSYAVQQIITRNIDDQQAHCDKLQKEIDDLTVQKKQCQIEIDTVKAQPAEGNP